MTVSFLTTARQTISAMLIAAVLVSTAGQTPAQQPAQQQPANDNQGLYKFKVESQLVLVNVVVRDKQGKPVVDLKRDDFTVLEDGKPQRISSFDFENLDSAPLASSSGPSQQSIEGKPAA